MQIQPLSALRKWTILTHRYLGIPFSVLFVVWFVSGIAMIYARGMPALTSETRLERMPALDFSRIQLSPSEAADAALLGGNPNRAVLLTIMGRPAYRFSTRGSVTVFADDGELFFEISRDDALAVASRFLGDPDDGRLEHLGILNEADQWTIGARAQLPMHKIRVDDSAGTELYISEQTGEVTVLTTRGSRALAWVAAIPHWLYFAPLRLNGPLWSQTVIWLSAIGCLMAVLGIVVGFLQFRPSRPFRLRRLMSYVPYRGLMRWHYITGFVFGIFTLTWVFSGLLSMDPWGWADGGGLETGRLQQTLRGGSLEMEMFPPASPDDWLAAVGNRDIKEVEFLRIQGGPYYSVTDGAGDGTLLSASPLAVRSVPFDSDVLLSQVHDTYSEASIVESGVLTTYDSYYYQRGGSPPLPVLRVKFDDPDNTWLYVDPARSRLVARLTDRGRLDRWIYNGFHSLDFGFWYNSRPAWDIGVIVLSIGGLSTSLIGMYLGFRRLGRGVFRSGATRGASAN
jgi:hypothetical protein